MGQPDERWNRNIHYHRNLLELASGGRALDVGCGEGMLCRGLAPLVDEVVGLDIDPPSIALARATTPNDNVRYVEDDFLTTVLAPASFDLVVSVAAIHHVDAASFLRRAVDVLRPGGRLGIVGIGRRSLPRDVPYELVAAVATRLDIIVNRRKVWNHSAPMVWPPPTTWAEIEVIARRELPGCDFVRQRQGRYTLTWTKPV